MSYSVDNRVVEMTFDNKQFEQGVQTSLKTLDKLNDKLKFKDAGNSLKALGGKFKELSFEGMYSGIDALQYRFSTLGIVGATVIQNLTNTALAFGRNLWSNTLGQIKSGGLARAMNIESAKFQLEGLEVEWEKIYDDIDYGVKNTAYGLDAAAKAASQLVASGVKFGDTFGETGNSPMAKALRGISGVAAMTNSSYEDISHIFTTIAGNGRVMGENLQQFAGRGLNVAATLAKAMHTTEENVRDMVSKGKIDFATFSEIMDEAFGEHAKDANKTFTGALSNMKAALSRIGASFAQPGLEKARDLFNSIRPIINGVHKAMAPMISDYEGFLNRVVPKITGALDKLAENGRFYRNLQLTYDILKQTVSWFLRYVQTIKTAFKDIVPKKTVYDIRDILLNIQRFVNGLKTYGATLNKLTRTFKGVFAIFEIFKIAVSSVLRLFSPLTGKTVEFGRAILGVTANIGDWLVNLLETIRANDSVYNALSKVVEFISTKFQSAKSHIVSFIETFKEFWNAKRMHELGDGWEGIEAIGEIFKRLYLTVYPAIKATVDVVKEAFKALGRAIVSLKPYLIDVIDFFIGVIGQLGRWAVKLNEFLKTNETLRTAVRRFYSALVKARTAVVDFFKSLGGKEKEKAEKSFSAMDFVAKTAEKIENALKTFSGAIKLIFSGIGTILKTAWSSIKRLLVPLVEGFQKAFDGITLDNFVDAINAGLFGGLLIQISRFLIQFQSKVKSIKQIFGSSKTEIQKFTENLNGLIKGLTDAIGDMSKANMIKSFAIAIAILAGSVFVLSTIEPDKLAMAIGALIVLAGVIAKMSDLLGGGGSIEGLKNAARGASIVSEASSSIIKMAVALLILAASVKMLGSMDPMALGLGLLAIIDLMLIMTVVAKSLSDKKTAKGFNGAAKSMIAMSIAIRIIAGAVKSLGKLEGEQLAKGLLGIIVLMATLATTAKYLGSNQKRLKNFTSVANSLIAMSIAIRIIAGAVKALGELDETALLKGVLSVGILISILGLFIAALSANNARFRVKDGLGIVLLASALIIMTQAVKQLGDATDESLFKGLAGVTALLAFLAIFANVMGEAKGVMKSAFAVVLMSAALLIITQGLKQIATLNWDQLILALSGLFLVLAMLAGVSHALPEDSLKTGAALAIMALSMSMLSKALTSFGNMTWENVGKSLTMFAGALAALVISAVVLEKTHAANALLKFGAAVMLIGAGIGLAGAGLFALSIALGSLAITAAPAAMSFVAALAIIADGIVGLAPIIVKAIGEAIVIFVQFIGNQAEAIINAVVQILRAVLQGIQELAPEVVATGFGLLMSLLQGIADNMDRITECAAIIIIKFLATLAQYMPVIVDAGMVLMVNFINGLANGVREHGDQLIAAIENLISSILEFVISALQELAKSIPVIGDGIAKGLEGIKQDLKNEFSVDEMATMGTNIVEGTAKGMDDHKDRLEQSSRGMIQSAKSGMEQESGFGSIFGGQESNGFLEAFMQNSVFAFDAGAGLSGSGLEGIMSNSGLYEGAGEELNLELLSGLNNADTGDVANSQLQDYFFGWSSGAEGASEASGVVAEATKAGLEEGNDELKLIGESGGEDYSEGIESKKKDARNAGSSLKTAAQAGASGNYLAMYGKGSDAGRGYYDGIMAWAKPVADASASMTNSGIRATQMTQESKSPSKVYRKLGSYAGEGYVGGITPFISKVADVAKNMVGSGIEIAEIGVSKISDILTADLDDAPVITPVLDLTNIQNGSNLIDSMLEKTRSFGVSASRNLQAIDGRSNLSSNLNTEGSLDAAAQPTYNFTQNNYSPKALSRIDIYRQTRNQFAQMKGLAGV